MATNKPTKKAKYKKPTDKTPRGRPTKYSSKFCSSLIDFFDVKPSMSEVAAKKMGDSLNGLIEFPTFEKFAAKIGVCVDTLHEWRKVHSEFSEAYTRAKEMQKHFLIQCGLNDMYNAGFAKFVAINCTDMSEKSTVEHTGLPEPPSTLEVVMRNASN